jgi:hypothetical protein
MGDAVCRVYVENGIGEVRNAIDASPNNVRVVKNKLRHVGSPLRISSDCPTTAAATPGKRARKHPGKLPRHLI